MSTQEKERNAAGPIFIGGISFSGKTILHAMLSAHPNIVITRHTYMWPRYYRRYGDLSSAENFHACLSAMLKDKHIRVLNPDPERIQIEFWQGPQSYGRLFGLFHQHYAEQIGKPRWGEQLSFIERFADAILASYPNARMIHMIRDPRERYEESMDHSSRRPWKVGLETANWLYSARLAERNRRQHQSSYKVVRYESVISDPEGALRDLCLFLQEDFMPAMLVPARRIAAERENYVQSNTEATMKNRPRGISEREIGYIQMYAHRYMLANAYQPETIQLPLNDRLRFYVFDWPTNLASMRAGNIFLSWRE